MNRRYVLPAVYLVDQFAGDPEWFPHPVRLMGSAIEWGESTLRRPNQCRRDELMRGAALTTVIVVSSYVLTRTVIREAYRCSRVLGWIVKLLLGWTCVAARSLEQEAVAVLTALDAGEIEMARRRLARIVGRDTEQLNIHEISRAVIETLAESASDGVIAPVFYMSLGGVPLAMAYKAINTLDSMIGHADHRYIYFGKAAARLDDVANYLPARLTALAIASAASVSGHANFQCAVRTWLTDGDKHKSPNAGQPESAMAGALQVRLGGGNLYAGEFVPGEPIGSEFRRPNPDDARNALHLVSIATLIGFGAGLLWASLVPRSGSR